MPRLSTYLAIDNEGNFFSLSLYNIDVVKVGSKMQKDVLVSVLNPEIKNVVYEGFKYTSVQVFEPIKLRINESWLTKEEFNPAEVRN